MYKLCVLALLSVPVAVLAQGDGASTSAISRTSDGAGGGTPEAVPQSAQSSQGGFFDRGIFSRAGKETPVATFTASYVYRYAPDLFGADRSQMGWSAVPEVNFGKYAGLQADFTSLYTRSIYPGTSQLLMAAGPRFTFAPRGRVTPFIFMEGGEIRTTKQLSDVSDWNPVAVGGIGLDFKAGRSKSWAFQLVPGEYLGQEQDDGSWNHSFVAKAGISFNLFR